jgi:signal transduction histidine kinase
MTREEDERLVALVHDLRTPLTVIAGFAELLERGPERLTEEQRTEYIARIAAASREMRDILDAERSQRLG